MALRPASEASARCRLPVVAINCYFGSGKTQAPICVVDEANFERMPEARKQVGLADITGPVVVRFVQHVAHPPVELEDWTDDDRRSRLPLSLASCAQTGGAAFLVDRRLRRWLVG